MKKLKEKGIINYLIIIFIAIIVCIPLFQEGIHTSHDGEFHMSRTMGTIEQISNRRKSFCCISFFK